MHFSFKELIVILIIVALVFGTKRLKSIGSDLGSALKGFRKAMHDGEEEEAKHDAQVSHDSADNVNTTTETSQAHNEPAKQTNGQHEGKSGHSS